MSNNPTKSICFFNSNKVWGGGEKWHFTTAKEFSHRGYKVMLVTNVQSELAKKAINNRLSVYSFFIGNLSFLNPVKILTMYALFKKEKIDVVVMNLPSDLKLAGIAAKLAGVKKIIYRRGMPHPLRNTWLNRLLFQKILTNVIVNSNEIGRSLKQGNESWFPDEKLVLIYNGVDTSLPPPMSKRLFPKADGEIIIGNVGRLTEQKGQKYLIEMAKELKSQGMKFKIMIAGDGELRSELDKQIREAKLDNEIKLLGHVDDIPSFFDSIDVFVFPSLYEGSANTLIESLYHEVPSVAFDISSNPEVIQHGVNGYLAKPYDSIELAKYVVTIVNSPERREEFGQNGRTFLIDRFDSKKNLNHLKDIF